MEAARSVRGAVGTSVPRGLESVLYFRILSFGSFGERDDVPFPALRVSLAPFKEGLGHGFLCRSRTGEIAPGVVVPALLPAPGMETGSRRHCGRLRASFRLLHPSEF